MEAGKARMKPEQEFSRVSGTPNRLGITSARISERVCLPAGTEQRGGNGLAFEESSLESTRQRFEASDSPDDVMKTVFLPSNVLHETGLLDAEAGQNRREIVRDGAALALNDGRVPANRPVQGRPES